MVASNPTTLFFFFASSQSSFFHRRKTGETKLLLENFAKESTILEDLGDWLVGGEREKSARRVFELFLNGREGGPARLSTRSVERAVYISESIDREETAPQETGRQEEVEEERGLFNDRAVSARR